MFGTPILYLVFNRPDLVEKSFESIRKIKPAKLFIAADGPRANNINDNQQCNLVRDYIDSNIDWPCDVKTLFRENNLGCGKAVSSAIDWFFTQVEMGIILEDDCLPSESFFTYCEELLIKYKDNKQIMHITGLNWQERKWRGDGDYYFSYYPGIWGWATWANRWSLYDFSMKSYLLNLDHLRGNLKIISNSKAEFNYHLESFDQLYSNKVDTWDFQWKYCVFMNLGLCVVPNKNLVSNIGWREDATHTNINGHWRGNRKTENIILPLTHPQKIKINKKADAYMASNLFYMKNKKGIRKFLSRIKRRLYKSLKLKIRSNY